jgi:hypothetical protein
MDDNEDRDAARLYGQPDEKRDVDAANGLRGEGGATGEVTSKRTVTMNGRTVEIDEESGPQ